MEVLHLRRKIRFFPDPGPDKISAIMLRMTIEDGRVIETGGGRVRVRMDRNDSCRACGLCLFARDGRGMILEAENGIGADAGDSVEVELNRRDPLAGAFLIFGLPLLAMLAGAGTGYFLLFPGRTTGLFPRRRRGPPGRALSPRHLPPGPAPGTSPAKKGGGGDPGASRSLPARTFRRRSLFDLQGDGTTKTLVTNAPYGVRLAAGADFCRRVGAAFSRLHGWRVCLLAGSPEYERSISIRPRLKTPLPNGDLQCDLLVYDIP